MLPFRKHSWASGLGERRPRGEPGDPETVGRPAVCVIAGCASSGDLGQAEPAHIYLLLVRCDTSRSNSQPLWAGDQWTSTEGQIPLRTSHPPAPRGRLGRARWPSPRFSGIQVCPAGSPLRKLQVSMSSSSPGSAQVWPRVEAHFKNQ